MDDSRCAGLLKIDPGIRYSPAMTTPMMSQWISAKKRHEDGILFFRMGDFFEFFHDDAKKAASLLGLTLTARSKGDDPIPMAGIPVKAAEGYIRRLVGHGEKVVICDQVQDPSEANGIVDRQVTRIVTPGTITEDEALDDRDNNFLVALDWREESCALAWVDLSTGEFSTRAVAERELVDELQRLDAAELLVAETFFYEDPRKEQIEAAYEGLISPRPDFAFEKLEGTPPSSGPLQDGFPRRLRHRG